MKPYNERLPMIDAAIEQGLRQENGDYVFFGKGAECFYYGNDLCSEEQDFICTRNEFNQRAKELGYINSYKYGVEYATSGEKPDLPDDVAIECFDGTEWWGGYDFDDNEYGYLTAKHIKFDTDVTEKFRIVDERYKPKEQGMNNDWYERGELPPVGIDCQMQRKVEPFKAGKVVFYGEHIFVWRNSDTGLECVETVRSVKFRPLPTETDKLVDEAMLLFSQTEVTSDAKKGIEHAVQKLIEQGYRKIKPMSRDEIMKRCVEICESDDTSLYEAGCRFIDKV